jgi:hypothetical protein
MNNSSSALQPKVLSEPQGYCQISFDRILCVSVAGNVSQRRPTFKSSRTERHQTRIDDHACLSDCRYVSAVEMASINSQNDWPMDVGQVIPRLGHVQQARTKAHTFHRGSGIGCVRGRMGKSR